MSKKYSKNSNFKKNTTYKAVRSKDQQQDKKIKSIERKLTSLRPELKYYDGYIANISPAGGASAYVCNILAQGDDFNQRIGEEVTAKYIDFFCRFEHLAGVNSSKFRVTVLWDKQWNGNTNFDPLTSTASVTTAMVDNSTISDRFIAPFNDRTSERYAILYDKTFVINPDSSSTLKEVLWKKKINLSNALIKYADSQGVVESLTSRALILSLFTPSSGTNSAASYRFHYTDA